MGLSEPFSLDQKVKAQILGYMELSSGATDPVFYRNVDAVFAAMVPNQAPLEISPVGVAGNVIDWLLQPVEGIELGTRAQAALVLVRDKLLPEYLRHHESLLFHQSPAFLFNSFFVARACQTVLRCDCPLTQVDDVVAFGISQLSDFLGHRPVATLESQQIEPYELEWIGPIPVYLKDVGVAYGPYRLLIEVALGILRETDPAILREACFSLDRLEELAIDPRAFDFDHPINKRPNHHFGQWDEHSVSQSGFFNRFLIHQVTLDSLIDRMERRRSDSDDRYNEQLMTEAGAVLACTMLMASGICGHGPGAFDSNTTLGSLLPTIAGYRDRFYYDLMQRLDADHQQRLETEAEARRQPFGSARQNLNQLLNKRRASQLVNCRLASIFARMGFAEAANRQSEVVPVAAARTLCQIDCMLSSAQQATKKKKLITAFEFIPQIMQLLKRGVACGAIVDPWNIIGFDANYSLFPATENSIPDHRVYELVDLVERIMGMCSLIWSEAASLDDRETCVAIKAEFSGIVDWWRKYAAHEVMSVDAVDPEEIFQAAEIVARALNLWHQAGAAAGDIEFWRDHAALFDSPKAYHLVIEALLDRGDYQTSSALLVHWLSQAEFVRLQHGDSSFHNLIWRWITEQKSRLKVSDFEQRNEIWNRIRKFYDFVEANAEHYGEVPVFELNRDAAGGWSIAEDEDDEENYDRPEDGAAQKKFGAAYEDVTFRDSTDDGNDGEIFDDGLTSDDGLEAEVDRVMDRLEFLATITNFYRISATFPMPVDSHVLIDDAAINQLKNRRDILSGWISEARRIRAGLSDLTKAVLSYKIPNTGTDHEAMMRYDRHRLYKESLLERITETCVESEHAVCMLASAIVAIDHLADGCPITELPAGIDGVAAPLIALFAAVMLVDIKRVKEHFPAAVKYLQERPLLYVPLDRGGRPKAIVSARLLQEQIRDLAGCLPVMGMFLETYELTATALSMERNHKLAVGAVTEFDDLFAVAYSAMVKCLVQSTQLLQQKITRCEEKDEAEAATEIRSTLFDCIEMTTESMSILWLGHNKTLRLSVLERVMGNKSWERLVGFIKRYGAGLFTQQFLQMSNARAILHQGVLPWLQNVSQSHDEIDLRLFDELGKAISFEKAAEKITLVLEAVCENYNEYRDYNTTTTQSDCGEMLYMLLDFLRLKSRYDRVCWFLKPMIWGHEILVRDGQNSVARMWRRSLKQQIGPEAEKYLGMLESLRNEYSIQMESVGRRLTGEFVHELQIDRLRSLVKPAMENPESRRSQRCFEKLQQGSRAFLKATPGVGVDVPAWLAELENEVQQLRLPLRLRNKNKEQTLIRPIDIPVSQLKEQLEQLPHR